MLVKKVWDDALACSMSDNQTKIENQIRLLNESRLALEQYNKFDVSEEVKKIKSDVINEITLDIQKLRMAQDSSLAKKASSKFGELTNSLDELAKIYLDDYRPQVSLKLNQNDYCFTDPEYFKWLKENGVREFVTPMESMFAPDTFLEQMEYYYVGSWIQHFRLKFSNGMQSQILGSNKYNSNRSVNLTPDRPITKVRTCWEKRLDGQTNVYWLCQFQLWSGDKQLYASGEAIGEKYIWYNHNIPQGERLIGLRVFGHRWYSISNLSIITTERQ